MINQIDNRLWFKANAATRYFVLYFMSGRTGFYPLVNEYPKSGGSWFAQMLSELLELPFPRNRLPMLRSSMMHGHYRYSEKLKDVSIVWRDGRDVMVSWYFHRVKGNELSSANMSNEIVGKLGIKDVMDVESNLPRFIEYTAASTMQPRFSWSDFVDQWHGKNCFFTRYEDLLTDPVTELRAASQWYGIESISEKKLIEVVEKFSFKNLSGRKPGAENNSSYLRSGTAGGWKSKFSPEAKEVFAHYYGDSLIKLGYETDAAWSKK